MAEKISREQERELRTRLGNMAAARRGYRGQALYGSMSTWGKKLVTSALSWGSTAEVQHLRKHMRNSDVDMSGARDMLAAYAKHQRERVPKWQKIKEMSQNDPMNRP